MVQAIIEMAEDRIIDEVFHAIFDRLADRQMQRVERRIKFILHPDRNTHGRSKDAF